MIISFQFIDKPVSKYEKFYNYFYANFTKKRVIFLLLLKKGLYFFQKF
ncbi:hypothetical protein M20_0533 [Lactococcus lactis subsp. lactis]|uniref:Uncharacterized protein n=1 Tax=Lactococcus lactis subsp. lactis TaxID=1360 RepID=A0A0V8E9W8_LACLL|nr:hypothetical protein BSR25_0867 [Lactococcus lactis subsp. lactis bv. diacetylactis]KSU22479.1 hypothetical protein M20_0533 [Lactococcus lactis subsp. lactis]